MSPAVAVSARRWTWSSVDDEGTALPALVQTLNRRMIALAATVAALGAGGTVATFAAGDRTPNIANASLWIEANPATTTITAFLGGSAGATIVVWGTTNHTTIAQSATLQLLAGVDTPLLATDARLFATADGVVWREVAGALPPPTALWA